MRHTEILLLTAFFAICHLASPLAFRFHERARHSVASFSGGLAAAYVLLHLLPEIDEGGELLGPRIYFVLLAGFALFYGMEVLIHRRPAEGAPRNLELGLHLVAAGLYNAMLVFTLNLQLPAAVGLTVLFAVTMGIHLLSADVGLQEAHGAAFLRRGRPVLIGAVLLGYALSRVREPHEEVIDLLTALLAGFMLFNAFRKELPAFHEARFLPFLSGMGLFLVGHLLLGA